MMYSSVVPGSLRYTSWFQLLLVWRSVPYVGATVRGLSFVEKILMEDSSSMVVLLLVQMSIPIGTGAVEVASDSVYMVVDTDGVAVALSILSPIM